ncbi:MAG: hypothetical protein ACP5D7_19545 [Limnospira sp.]
MIDPNYPTRTRIGFFGLLFGIVLLAGGAIALAGGPPPQQGKPAIQEPAGKPVEVEENGGGTPSAPASPFQPGDRPVEDTEEPPPQFPLPSARVSPVNGQVTLRLVNSTNTVVEYQVVGGTRQRILGQQSETVLERLPIPLNLTYQRGDAGLLLVRPRAVEDGVLEVRFNVTDDLDFDTKSLNINEQGTVFLN